MKKLMDGNHVVAEAENFAWVAEQKGWGEGKTIYVDPGKKFIVVADSPQVSPVEFKLLFSIAERVAIKAARDTDPVIDDFYDIVEDPRLTHVDLGLQSTRDALGYMVSIGLITAERQAEILSGQVQ